MAKAKRGTVTIRIGRNGSMEIKSTGGIDIRKIMPQLFGEPTGETPNAEPASEAEAGKAGAE